MITLISPLLAVCFAIYVMLILVDYMRGGESEPILDFLLRMAGWGAIIVFGLNIDMYKLYVTPLVSGLGEDLTGTVSSKYNSAAALDQMASAFLDSFLDMYDKADGIKQAIFAALTIFILSVPTSIFMVIAIGYIILSKVAVGILVAVGPFFIAAAMFPASRDLFKNWTAQCLSYAFLVMLFSFAAQIEIQFVSTLVPKDFALVDIFACILTCCVMVFVSLNLPSLAAALAGGIGISTMVRKLPRPSSLPRIEPGKTGTNTIEQKGLEGGALTPEQK
ncbi:type IV secretion system protein [Massilia sp. LXY-6]|uniref:type IV secretion system protein n=1 Tax=Massilia sp. LXY-6 TaxID=3379823 RepID=UPI003EDF293C